MLRVCTWNINLGLQLDDILEQERAGIEADHILELSEEGGSTKIVFDQAGFPAEAGPHLESGWAKMYWEPLKAYLAEAVHK